MHMSRGRGEAEAVLRTVSMKSPCSVTVTQGADVVLQQTDGPEQTINSPINETY